VQLGLLLAIAGVAATYWIYSNIVTVHVGEYTLSLNAPSSVVTYQNISFTGSLTYDGAGVSAETIHIYRTDGTGLIQEELGTTLTIGDGTFSFEWNATITGDLHFKAGWQTP